MSIFKMHDVPAEIEYRHHTPVCNGIGLCIFLSAVSSSIIIVREMTFLINKAIIEEQYERELLLYNGKEDNDDLIFYIIMI